MTQVVVKYMLIIGTIKSNLGRYCVAQKVEIPFKK